MKLLPLLLLAPALAHASWFDFEAGIGAAQALDIGDGVWVQSGAPHNRERLNSPAYLAGVTGDLTANLSWHADYVYMGGISASVDGVPDANYDPHTHRITSPSPLSPFNGQGHTQGVMLTLEPHVMYRGLRFGAEAGPWFYWNTWHETVFNLAGQWQDLSHKTRMQVGAVAGLSVSAGDWRLAYRYFYQRQSWNPYPALTKGAHMISFEKKF